MNNSIPILWCGGLSLISSLISLQPKVDIGWFILTALLILSGVQKGCLLLNILKIFQLPFLYRRNLLVQTVFMCSVYILLIQLVLSGVVTVIIIVKGIKLLCAGWMMKLRAY